MNANSEQSIRPSLSTVKAPSNPNEATKSAKGRVFYDGDCASCSAWVARYGRIFARRGFVFEPLQQVMANAEFALPAEEFLREMKLLHRTGRWFGGADAWIVLFKSVWWLWPIGVLAGFPGFHTLAHRAYRQFAANRHCLDGRCKANAKPKESA